MSDDLNNWREEKQSAYLYRLLARREKGTPREQLFRSLSEAAEKQSQIWEASAQKSGRTVPRFSPDSRAKTVAFLIRHLGARPIRPVLAAMKVRGLSTYVEGHTHALAGTLNGPEPRHSASNRGGNLRAAVFGMNDGLVSNASLILGIAGAAPDSSTILVSGVAGLLAGAFSMATGEYVSVRSQRELFEYQIGLEREELDRYPEEEARELALIYEAKGLSVEEAKTLADKIIADPRKALDTLAREELGLNPDELGSPRGAAVFSFCSFATGAIVPLLPFLLLKEGPLLPYSIGLTAITLFIVGAALSLFTGRNAALGGLRMLLLGGSAGAATYFIGSWFSSR